METLESVQEITQLSIDIPIYMLEHMPAPSPEVMASFIQFLDDRMALEEDTDHLWDLRMGNSLALVCVAKHPDALALCLEIYNWVEDASDFLKFKVLRLIETAVDPIQHHSTARRWLMTLGRGQELHLPLTLLVAKSKILDEQLQNLILNYWHHEPLIGSQLMSVTKSDIYLELIERELVWLAPFVRYLAPDEQIPRTRLIEHDLWQAMGEAWFNIAQLTRPTPAWLDPSFVLSNADDIDTISLRHQEWREHLDAYLMERFAAELPWTKEEWIKKIDSSPEFGRWKNRFIEALQMHSEFKHPMRQGLRLVKPVE